MVVVGLVALLVAVVGQHLARQEPDEFGSSVPATGTRAPAGTGIPTSPGARGEGTAGQGGTAAVPARSPTELAIPAIRVLARVRPVGAVGGTLQIPENPAEVGWWAGSVPPAAREGSVVLAGHVDSRAGPGALFRLTELRSGDEVRLTDGERTRHAYTVTGRRVFRKASGLPADLFAADGPHRLVIITCGGPFNRATRQYRDNIIVFAAPAAEENAG